MILLSRPYFGYLANTIVEFLKSTEDALIAQRLGADSAGPVTPGAVTTTAGSGRVGIAAGASSVVITNPNITAQSQVVASLCNAVADGTATFVTRIVPTAGSVTIHVNANATAAIAIKWSVLDVSGGLLPGV